MDAHKSLGPYETNEMYRLILFALRNIKQGTTEQIAAALKLDHGKVWKRVSEMARINVIYRPGHKLPTKSGRDAYVWAEVKDPSTDVQKTEPKPIGIREYSEAIDKIKQQTLF